MIRVAIQACMGAGKRGVVLSGWADLSLDMLDAVVGAPPIPIRQFTSGSICMRILNTSKNCGRRSNLRNTYWVLTGGRQADRIRKGKHLRRNPRQPSVAVPKMFGYCAPWWRWDNYQVVEQWHTYHCCSWGNDHACALLCAPTPVQPYLILTGRCVV